LGEEDQIKKIRDSLIDSRLKSIKKRMLDKKILKIGKKRKKMENPKGTKVQIRGWEQELRNPNFCKSLTSDIKDENLRDEKFIQCLIDPPRFVESNYKKELKTFGGGDPLNIENFLECKKTENIINLMAKEKEGKKDAYKINYCEGIKRTLTDLKNFKDKEIEPLDEDEKEKTYEKNEKNYYELVESCLPTESHLIERIKVVPPKSDPSAGEGNSILRFLRSLLSSKKPKNITPTKIRPRTVAVSHAYEHDLDKFDHEEHLERDWEKDFFEKAKSENRILKKVNNNED